MSEGDVTYNVRMTPELVDDFRERFILDFHECGDGFWTFSAKQYPKVTLEELDAAFESVKVEQFRVPEWRMNNYAARVVVGGEEWGLVHHHPDDPESYAAAMLFSDLKRRLVDE